MTVIETERLKIYPAGREDMEAQISQQTDAELIKAYTEMLEGCLAHPEQWEWYAMWYIELKDGTRVGDLCFKGLGADGMAEIGYGILDEYQRRGYCTESVRASVEWALTHGAYSVEAETDPGNIASQRVLRKCGFAPNGVMGEEGPRYIYVD